MQVIFEFSVFFASLRIYFTMDAMKNKTIVLTGGGSGGHVIPILALLPEIKENFDKIYFVGGSGIEKTLVKDAGVFYHEIHTVGLDRTHVFKNLKIPFVLFKAVREQKRFLREIHPDIVFSKGGFISLPTVLAARKLKIPCVAHESDLSLGLANRIAGKKGATILTGFDKTATLSDDFIYVGFPLRQELKNIDKDFAVNAFKLDNAKKTLLVMGGSLGAQAINDVLNDSLDALLPQYNVLHVTGKNKSSITPVPGYFPIEYTDDIGALFAAADTVVSRAGAGTLFELSYLEKPVLLIPLPKTASRGDQIDNALYAKEFGAKVLFQEDLTKTSFVNAVMRCTVPMRPFAPAGNNAIGRILTSFADNHKTSL